MKIVELLLNKGANVNNTSKTGITPLHLAAEHGTKDILKLLLTSGANVDAKGQDDKTPLHTAAVRGHLKIIDHLLKSGASVNSTCTYASQEGYTALRLAIKHRHEKVVKLLLECGAKDAARDKDNKTILHFAVESGSSIITEHILKHCSDLNNESNSSIVNFAVRTYGEDRSDIIKNLLEYGFTVDPEDANNREFLLSAVARGYSALVQELLKNGADVNTLYDSTSRDGCTLLHIASRSRQEEVAKLLISCGADVNAQDTTGKTPIFYVTENGDLKIAKLLLTNKANVKDRPELLNNAVRKKYREIIEVLLEHGADVNSRDKYGRTALHFAAFNKCGRLSRSIHKDPDINVKGEIAKLLLSRGANVNAETEDGVTALQAAAHNGYANVVEALLEYNADVNFTYKTDTTPSPLSAQESNEGINAMPPNKGADTNTEQRNRMTALHIAARKGHKEIVELLIERGSYIDSKITSDIMHIAAENGDLRIMMILLKFGVCVDSKDEHGATALHIASMKGHTQIVIALLDHGSDITITNGDNDTALKLAENRVGSFHEIITSSDQNRDDYFIGLGESSDSYHKYHDNHYPGAEHSYDSIDKYLAGEYSDDEDCSNGSADDYYDYDPVRSIHAHEEIANILRLHAIKVISANLYASNKDLLSISSVAEDQNKYRIECEEEVANMKRERVGNSSVSFYDVLTKGISQLAIYAGNKSIVEVFKSSDWRDDFPEYENMINNQFRKGRRRKEILDEGNTIFHFFFNNFLGLPHYCTEEIFSYLSNEDLRTLMDACRPISVSSPT